MDQPKNPTRPTGGSFCVRVNRVRCRKKILWIFFQNSRRFCPVRCVSFSPLCPKRNKQVSFFFFVSIFNFYAVVYMCQRPSTSLLFGRQGNPLYRKWGLSSRPWQLAACYRCHFCFLSIHCVQKRGKWIFKDFYLFIGSLMASLGFLSRMTDGFHFLSKFCSFHLF